MLDVYVSMIQDGLEKLREKGLSYTYSRILDGF